MTEVLRTRGAYVVALHVPLFLDGPRILAASEWVRALKLLRDSLESHFGPFVIVAPTRLAESEPSVLEPIGPEDGFEPRPSIPLDGTKRDYWLGGGRRRWQADVAQALEGAAGAHLGYGDLYRPFNNDALSLALAAQVTTVMTRDTDEIAKIRALIAAGQMRGGPDRAIYLALYARGLRHAVARADLALLKGRTLYDLYAPYARNPKMHQDTSYKSDEIVSRERVTARLAARGGCPLRLVYAGRFVARKGVDRSIGIVARARGMGTDVTLDLIGDGPERKRLETLTAREGVSGSVRFLGAQPYEGMIDRLAEYDALLFTPVAEDTPRMIFDGYAAGLPLLGHDIPYVIERGAEENATLLLPLDDMETSASRIAALSKNADELIRLTWNAHRAAALNATDVWYARRAEWTIEAHQRRLVGG